MASTKRPILISAGIILVIAGLVGGLWVTNVFGWRAWRLQEVQGFIGASLPEGASEIQYTTRNQYTRIVWLRFSLSHDADLAAFLSRIGITARLKEGYTPFPAANPQESALTWWQPVGSSSYSGLYWNTGTKTIEILVDKTNERKDVFYLRAYAFAQD